MQKRFCKFGNQKTTPYGTKRGETALDQRQQLVAAQAHLVDYDGDDAFELLAHDSVLSWRFESKHRVDYSAARDDRGSAVLREEQNVVLALRQHKEPINGGDDARFAAATAPSVDSANN